MTNPKPLSEERLCEIEARAKAATPGPWVWEEGLGITCAEYERNSHTSTNIVEIDSGVYPPWGADGPFIAHSRADIPDLIAECRRLRFALFLIASKDTREGENAHDATLVARGALLHD